MYLWPWSLFSHQKWNNCISQMGQPANLCYIVPPVLFWFYCNLKLTFQGEIKNTARKNCLLLARCLLWLHESRDKFGSVTRHSHLIKSHWSHTYIHRCTNSTEYNFSWSLQIFRVTVSGQCQELLPSSDVFVGKMSPSSSSPFSYWHLC